MKDQIHTMLVGTRVALAFLLSCIACGTATAQDYEGGHGKDYAALLTQIPKAKHSLADGEDEHVGQATTWNYDYDKPGTLPEGWKAEGTNQRGPVATWVIKTDASAPSKPNVLALKDAQEGWGGTFNLLWTDRVKFKDGVIEVKVKAGTGCEDQGGGPIWRVQDKDNYYIARWNPLEDNFRVYSVKDGRRKMLESASVKADPAKWHTIRIEQKGKEIECYLDGQELLKGQDRTFPDAGGVGLWTKADAATLFDDLVVKGVPIEGKEGK